MKKIAVGVLFLMCFAFSGILFAMTPEEAKQAHFKEMKEIKEKQRQERETIKKSSPAKSNVPGFWEKEGERSGLTESGSGAGKFLKNLNPVPFFKEQKERYEARKAGAVK